MLTSYVIGALGTVALGVFWVAVQCAWREAFPGVFRDPDVLAERQGCHGCTRVEACEHRTNQEGAP